MLLGLVCLKEGAFFRELMLKVKVVAVDIIIYDLCSESYGEVIITFSETILAVMGATVVNHFFILKHI